MESVGAEFRRSLSTVQAPGIDSMSRVILAAPHFAAAICRAGTARTILPAATVPGHIKTRQPEKSRGSTSQLPHGFKRRPSSQATPDRLAPGKARGAHARNVVGPGKRGEAIWLPEPDYRQSLRVRLGNGIGPGNAKGLQPVGCSPRSTLKSGRTRPEITAS